MVWLGLRAAHAAGAPGLVDDAGRGAGEEAHVVGIEVGAHAVTSRPLKLMGRACRIRQSSWSIGFSTGAVLIGFSPLLKRPCAVATAAGRRVRRCLASRAARPPICDEAGPADARKRFESLGLCRRDRGRPRPRPRAPRNAARAPRIQRLAERFRHVARLDGVSPEVIDAALAGVAYEASVKAHDHRGRCSSTTISATEHPSSPPIGRPREPNGPCRSARVFRVGKLPINLLIGRTTTS